jgi:hypothetical protein
MREHTRRDGAVVLTGDDGDDDQVTVEARVVSFTPIRNGLQCPCGALLRAFALRATADGAELCCHKCHRVHGSFELGVKVYR